MRLVATRSSRVHRRNPNRVNAQRVSVALDPHGSGYGRAKTLVSLALDFPGPLSTATSEPYTVGAAVRLQGLAVTLGTAASAGFDLVLFANGSPVQTFEVPAGALTATFPISSPTVFTETTQYRLGVATDPSGAADLVAVVSGRAV